MTSKPTSSPTPNPQTPAPLITLTTDFGTADTFVAQMKGVIAGIAPGITIIDATHEVPPQDVMAGALALDSIVDAFPVGTVHLAVVDPGVGSERLAIAAQTKRFTLIGPDNGLFTAVLDRYPPAAVVGLTNPAYHRAPASPTFHGRDIFAPAAAYLANGVAIGKFGDPVTTLVNLNIPKPSETPEGLTAVVLLADHFGNLITSLTRDRFDRWLTKSDLTDLSVTIGGRTLGGVPKTFTDVSPGEWVAYFGSGGRLEIAVRNGSASTELGAARGTAVTVRKSLAD